MSSAQIVSFDGLEVTPDVSSATVGKAAKKEVTKRKRSTKKKGTGMGEKIAKYQRGERNEAKEVKSNKLKRQIKQEEKKIMQATEKAARAEILLPSEVGYLEAEGINRTWRFTQDDLANNVDVRSQKKMFELKLSDFGPYCMDFTRNGRNLLLAGRKGHIAMLDWQKFSLTHEFHVKEAIRDATYLHDETMIAVAQKKYTYIYDNNGIELHCLRNHFDVNKLQFLPYHFLLATVGKSGYLKYQDTSTGQIICELRTKLGDCEVMGQNRRNAILHLGHSNGQVTLWSPNMSTPLVKMQCHKAPLLDLDVDIHGQYMVTSGLDGQVKVWDVRTYKEVHSYFTVRPASTVDISDMGMLALGYGSHVQVWKDALKEKAKDPYMVKQLPGMGVQTVRFCPFEDVLGVSHSDGYSSMLVPGSGEPNFDTFEANPFENKKQRREATVHRLLDKLQPDMITLDPTVFGMMDRQSQVLLEGERKSMREARREAQAEATANKNKMRGGNKSTKKFRRKRANVVDQKAQEHKERVDKQQQERARAERQSKKGSGSGDNAAAKSRTALDRFH